MSNVFVFAIVGLFAVTGILAHADDKDRQCGVHGDPCIQGCCDGFKCNKVAERCMTIINKNTLKEASSRLKHVGANVIGNNDSSEDKSCGKHGDFCSQGCCKEFQCNPAAGRCMAIVTGDMLNDGRLKLKHVQASSAESDNSAEEESCGTHGDSCSQGCCEGFQCNPAAGRCMAVITSDILNDGHSKLKHTQTRVVRSYLSGPSSYSNRCGKHGDPCAQGCCSGFQCNPAAGRCMTTITADMLNDARSKLKHVEAKQIGSGVSGPSPKNLNCGKHGDSCEKGCCNGFSCNSYAERCMAVITADMLKDARSKLKPVRTSAIAA